MAKEMLESRYPELDYTRVKRVRKELMDEHIRCKGIDLKLGAKEILSYLKDRGITSMVATSTDYDLALRCLKETGLYDDLDSLISANDVPRGKPYPDIYEYACRKMGLRPQDCYAVEDSFNGIRSAISAGCRTIMVPDGVMPDEEWKEQLALLTDSLFDLIQYFERFDTI